MLVINLKMQNDLVHKHITKTDTYSNILHTSDVDTAIHREHTVHSITIHSLRVISQLNK